MFGGGTLAVVTDPGPLLRSKAGREAVERLLVTVAPGNALVFVEIGDGRKRSATLQALESAVRKAGGTSRGLRRPEGRRARRLAPGARRGRWASPSRTAAARELARRVGGFVTDGDVDRRSMSALAVSELEKLALYRPTAP